MFLVSNKRSSMQADLLQYLKLWDFTFGINSLCRSEYMCLAVFCHFASKQLLWPSYFFMGLQASNQMFSSGSIVILQAKYSWSKGWLPATLKLGF